VTQIQDRTAEFATMLRLNPIFGDLDAPVIDALARRCGTKTLAAGAVLFQKGDPGDALYGVRRGQVAVEVGTAEGQRLIHAVLGPGDVFGEIAVLDGGGRTADIVATEATTLFVLRRQDVVSYMTQEPRVAIKLMEVVCRRLRSVTTQIEQSLTQKLDARLAGRLIMLAEDFGDEIAITQDQLARHVGATRESVNRQLQNWQQNGLLALARGRVVLKDAARLRSLARATA
jgi:CRP/FNR family transcriptional regulator, cyclic AMP receptor protein